MSRRPIWLLSLVPLLAAVSSPSEAQQAKAADAAPYVWRQEATPLFFREAWMGVPSPPVEHGGPLNQKNVSNPNLELNLYGTATDIDPARGFEHGIQINAGPGPAGTGHMYTGLCDRPCGMTLRDRRNYVDLTGYAKIRWSTRVSGLHMVHPLIKLADGTWLLGEHVDGTLDDYHLSEFAPSATRWIEMDMSQLVTRGHWLEKVDLSKVDEIGYVDVMQGGGHTNGGYVTVDLIEVYGKPVPRTAAAGH